MNPAHAHDAQSKRDIRTAPTGEAAPGREHEARGEGGDDGREAKDAAPALLTAGRPSSPGGGGQEGRPRGGSLTLRGGGARGRQVVLYAGVGGGERSSLSFLTHDDLRAYAYEGDASPSGSLTSTVMGAARIPLRGLTPSSLSFSSSSSPSLSFSPSLSLLLPLSKSQNHH